MSVYAIILNEPNSEVLSRVNQVWPNHNYPLSETVIFVAPEGISLVQQIVTTAGMVEEEKVFGVVLEMPAASVYRGWNDQNLWEWLDKAHGRR